MTDARDLRWLAAILASESNDPREWWAVGWVVRNRLEDRRYPKSYEGLALQPYQFSYFNWAEGLELDPDVVFWQSLRPVGNHEVPRALGLRIFEAYEAAVEIDRAPVWRAPWHPDVVFYYSPVSMLPPGSQPWWWDREVGQTLHAPGVDPARFTFGRRQRA